MSDIAGYRDPFLRPSPDVNAAIQAFIALYALPALPPEAILAGYQNRISLPKGTNNFAVYNANSRERVGTNVEDFVAGNGEVPDHTLISTLYRIPVRIELYSDTDMAFSRAACLEMVSRSPAGVRFFQDRGLSLLYADPPKDTTVVMDGEEYVPRWSITVHLSCCVCVGIALQGFDAVEMSRVEDVTAHHPVNK